MMIFWKARLAILAVPKTGSSALQHALWPYADAGLRHPPFYRHMNLAWFQRWSAKLYTAEEVGRIETLAVVRDPISWLSSWYRYRRRDEVAGKPVSTGKISFGDFVEAWLDEAPPEFARVGRPSRFCTGTDGRIGIDHIFAYEAQPALLGFLEDRIGVPVAPARRNVSPRAEVSLSDALSSRLHREASSEFDLHARARR